MALPMDSVHDRYLVWKKNAPLLYKQLLTSSLLWPSLCLDWLPDVDASVQGPFEQHRLVTGSYSSGMASFETLQICSIDINTSVSSKGEARLPDFEYDDNVNEFSYTLPTPYKKVKRETNEDGEESRLVANNALNISQRIPHLGDINKLKHMPTNPDIIATTSNSGIVRIFDRTKKSNTYCEADLQNDTNGNAQNGDLNDLADVILLHHKAESWTLDWNLQTPKVLATADNDGVIAIWDLEKQFEKPMKLDVSATSKRRFASCVIEGPVGSVMKHDYGVNEINWIPDHSSLVASVGEDGYYRLTDVRDPQSTVLAKNVTLEDNQSPLNCLNVNPLNTFEFVTGSSNGNMYVYDVRQENSPVHLFKNACEGSINSAKFSPFKLSTKFGDNSTVIVSGGSDGLVKIWNMDSDGKDTSNLLFVHGGHLLEINDICWSASKSGLLASSSADNSVHIWEPNL